MTLKSLFFEGSNEKTAFWSKPPADKITFGLIELEKNFSCKLVERFPVPTIDATLSNQVLEQKDGQPVNGLFLMGTATNKGSYISFSLENATGTFEGRQWINSDADLQLEKLNQQSIVSITAKLNEFPKKSGRFSLMCSAIKPADYNDDTALLQRQMPDDTPQAIVDEFFFYISLLSKPFQNTTFYLLDDLWADFSLRYGAKGHHHNYRMGLLQHTTEVMRIAYHIHQHAENPTSLATYLNIITRTFQSLDWKKMLTDLTPQTAYKKTAPNETSNHIAELSQRILTTSITEPLSLDTLLFGIIFHDIGKIIEYSSVGDESGDKYKRWFGDNFEVPHHRAGAIDMDVLGKRFGHIQLGVMYISRQMYQNNTELSLNDWLDTLAVIQSHHYKPEWGSPVVPRTTVEFVVHLADFIDARIASEF